MSTIHTRQRAMSAQPEGTHCAARSSRSPLLPPQAPPVVFVKGAPREVLQLCTHILVAGQVRLLDESLRIEINAAIDDYARNALRVLALARGEMLPLAEPQESIGRQYTSDRVERNLTFLGLVSLSK